MTDYSSIVRFSQYVIAPTRAPRSGAGGKQLSEMKELVVIKLNLQPFSEREALGQYWLKDLDNGAYRQEFYVAHISMSYPFLLFSVVFPLTTQNRSSRWRWRNFTDG